MDSTVQDACQQRRKPSADTQQPVSYPGIDIIVDVLVCRVILRSILALGQAGWNVALLFPRTACLVFHVVNIAGLRSLHESESVPHS